MTLGERIRNLRKSKKMTLVDLAGNEITKGMLSLIENDKSKPSMDTLQHIAKALEVSIGYLTQKGDDEWTRSIMDYEGFTDSFNFPFEFIEETVLPNLDKVAQNSNGMRLYHALRIYYRLNKEHEMANAYTDKINDFYKGLGMEHLVARNKLDDATSLMYSRDYEEAYHRILAIEEEVLEFKEYDSRVELDHLYHKSILAASVDTEAHVRVGNDALDLSFELENFKYFGTLNLLLGMYYRFTGEFEKFEEFQENIKKYLSFNTNAKYKIDFMDLANPIPDFYILVEDRNECAGLYEDYLIRVDEFMDEHPERYSFTKYYRGIFELELCYFQGKYQEVVDEYHDDMYIRPIAQHPIDRIIMAVRSSVYPLSLYYLGRKEEARAEFNKIEKTIEDIKDSIFAKEFYMIQDIIFEK